MDRTLEAFQAADDFIDAAVDTAHALRQAAVVEIDPDIAAELSAKANIIGLIKGLADWADDVNDPRIVSWSLAVAGRLLSDPELLADLAPHVMPGLPPAIEPARHPA